VELTPEQLRRAIGRNKLRSIAAGAAGVIVWFGALAVFANIAGPLTSSWMLPVTASFIIGGLCAMILPVYFLNRRYAPRCPSCRFYLSDEEIADFGKCPRCQTKLFE
jgi:hypothetical protein